MSAFKKKPQEAPTIEQMSSKLNMLLGLGCSQIIATSQESKQPVLTKQLILSSAMFWDSKKRIDKIKSLMLKDIGLKEFNDTDDFEVSELLSIELLSLSRNTITYLQPLASLQTLICLNVNHNKIYDISPLSSLTKLEQLYASNNLITHIDALRSISTLRILNLYSNKISRLDQTMTNLRALSSLQQLDIDQNPVYTSQNRKEYVSLSRLVRLNGELILEDQRQQLGFPNISMVSMPSAKFRDTHTSFFNSNKSKISTSTAVEKSSNKGLSIMEAKNALGQKMTELERKYFELDDIFEEQIVKNVRVKSQVVKMSQKKRVLQRKAGQIKDKEDQIVQLKRKVKMLKQNLFNNQQSQRKGELLRELFQLQIMGEPSKNKSNKNETDPTKTNDPNAKIWCRKFDYDEEIVVQVSSDDKYLLDEDEELAYMLSQNNSALQQLKRELRELNP